LARTGVPVQLSQAGTGLNVSRPDYVGGQAILGDYQKTLQYLNRSAFDLVPIDPVSRISVRPGNGGNNAIREPGAVNLNVGLSKEFSLTERSRLKLVMDAFNFFNHTNLTGLVTHQQHVLRPVAEYGRCAADSVEWTLELVARCRKAGPGSTMAALPSREYCNIDMHNTTCPLR
jgi:hypothetical protein